MRMLPACTPASGTSTLPAGKTPCGGLLLAGPVLGPVLKTTVWNVALTVVFAPLAIRQFRRLA
jgi:hypothetical protein